VRRRRRTPRQWIAASLRNICVGISLKRFTNPDEMSTDELSMLENYGLECFRLGIEYEREQMARDSQRPTIPAPPEDDDDR
jgi:hypothetical protein